VTDRHSAIRLARLGDAAAIARVETETWRDAYPTLLPSAYLVQGRGTRLHWQRRLQGAGRKILVAETADQRIAAYATWGPLNWRPARPADPPPAQLHELYVHMDHRENGIGRRLCAEIARRAAGNGARQLYVEVLDGNPSRFFYENLGAQLASRGHHDFAGQRLPSVIYLWNDLKSLADRSAA